MELDQQDISTTLNIINKDFGLENSDHEILSKEALLKWLTQVINYLLEKNFEKLLQAMYRIDISEEKFKSIFSKEGNIAEELAQLVLDRELQKVYFRKRYNS